jgi:hypothetical protein
MEHILNGLIFEKTGTKELLLIEKCAVYASMNTNSNLHTN